MEDFAVPADDGKSLKSALIDDRRRGHDEADAAGLGRSLRASQPKLLSIIC
jgi:hypothetical protein